MMSIKVNVTAYQGRIVFEPVDPLLGVEDEWWPTDIDPHERFGSVVGSSASRVGISQEALELMKTIKVGCDAIGDIDWWLCTDGSWAFSWFGCLYRVMDPVVSISSRDFNPYQSQLAKAFVLIANAVPLGAREAIDHDPECGAWKEPYQVPNKLYETLEAKTFSAARETRGAVLLE